MQVYSDERKTITTGEQSCVGVCEKLKSSNTVWYNCKKGCQRIKTEKQTYSSVKKKTTFNNRCITVRVCLRFINLFILSFYHLIISYRLFTRWKNKFRKHFTHCTRLMAKLRKKNRQNRNLFHKGLLFSFDWICCTHNHFYHHSEIIHTIEGK